MKNIFLYLLVLIFLFACATSKKYDEKLNSMIGESTSSLTNQWGRPSAKKYLDNGDVIYSYTKANDIYVPSEFYVYNQGFEPSEDVVYSPFLSDYDFGPWGETFGYEVTQVCQTSFLIQDGVITSWRWKGNNCVAK